MLKNNGYCDNTCGNTSNCIWSRELTGELIYRIKRYHFNEDGKLSLIPLFVNSLGHLSSQEEQQSKDNSIIMIRNRQIYNNNRRYKIENHNYHEINDFFAKSEYQRKKHGVEANMGPQSYADVELNTPDSRARLMYCGSTLQRFRYYAPSVCKSYLRFLAGRPIELAGATERDFMEALERTSQRMSNTHIVRMTPAYMGPQCISHLADATRVAFAPSAPRPLVRV